MNILNFDLNLLRVLDVLLRERNVSRAAEQLALSQPAVSNALNRLRETLDDPLLVRVGRQMQPTPRALALEAPLRQALQQIAWQLSDGRDFDPARAEQRFEIAVTDYVEQLLMPELLARLAEQAPGLAVRVRHLTPQLPAEALDSGELDVLIGRFFEVPNRFARRPWRSETLRIVAAREHPQLRSAPDLAQFLRLRHLWVSGGQTRGMVDQWLSEQGLSRQVVYTTPNYLQAAHLVVGSDLVTVLPTSLAEHFAQLLPLALYPLPFALGPFHLQVVSSALRARDPALQWLLEQIDSLAAPSAN